MHVLDKMLSMFQLRGKSMGFDSFDESQVGYYFKHRKADLIQESNREYLQTSIGSQWNQNVCDWDPVASDIVRESLRARLLPVSFLVHYRLPVAKREFTVSFYLFRSDTDILTANFPGISCFCKYTQYFLSMDTYYEPSSAKYNMILALLFFSSPSYSRWTLSSCCGGTHLPSCECGQVSLILVSHNILRGSPHQGERED